MPKQKLPATVRVRCETAMWDLAWGEVAELTRTEAVEAAIEQGRLTVLDDEENSDVQAVPPAGDETTDRAGETGESGGQSAAEVS